MLELHMIIYLLSEVGQRRYRRGRARHHNLCRREYAISRVTRLVRPFVTATFRHAFHRLFGPAMY